MTTFIVVAYDCKDAQCLMQLYTIRECISAHSSHIYIELPIKLPVHTQHDSVWESQTYIRGE